MLDAGHLTNIMKLIKVTPFIWDIFVELSYLVERSPQMAFDAGYFNILVRNCFFFVQFIFQTFIF